MSIFLLQLYHTENKLRFRWDDEYVRIVLEQHAKLDFYSASFLKQQSTDRRAASLGHIILNPIQPVCTLTPLTSQKNNKYQMYINIDAQNVQTTYLWGYHTLQGDNSLKPVERFDHMMFVCRFQASRWSKPQREKLLCG